MEALQQAIKYRDEAARGNALMDMMGYADWCVEIELIRRSMEDKVIQAVCDDLRKRSEVGIKKYGVTLERTDLSLRDWLQHAYEECLDTANYLKRAMMEIDNSTEDHKQTLTNVTGAIKSTIDAHGPITLELSNSAAKRIIGVFKNKERLTWDDPAIAEFDKPETDTGIGIPVDNPEE